MARGGRKTPQDRGQEPAWLSHRSRPSLHLLGAVTGQPKADFQLCRGVDSENRTNQFKDRSLTGAADAALYARE